MTITVTDQTFTLNKTAFKSNSSITHVNACNIPWLNNSMSEAFRSCTSLASIEGLNDSVTNMYCCFYGCTGLLEMPELPSSVTNLSYTFCGCTNLVEITDLPYNVTDVSYMFYNCTLLTTSPDITSTVTNMSNTYRGCTSLTGDVHILSKNITNVTNCFYGTTLPKYVYIPFKNTDGTYTTTYNTFIAAGYTTTGTKEGVYLKDVASNEFTLTIVPYPEYADVNLTATNYHKVGNSITVPYGTEVTWSITYPGYVTQNGKLNVLGNTTLEKTLSKVTYNFTINPTPSDAVVTLTSIGYTQVGNTITVPKNTEVSWKVEKENYTTQEGTTLVENSSLTVNKTLSLKNFTFGLRTNVSNPTITLSSSSGTQNGNLMVVPYGSSINWSVSKEGYVSQSGTQTVTQDTFLLKTLEKETYTYTINPNPSDATVILTADGYTQVGNSITVGYNTVVNWSVSKEHYDTQSGSSIIANNITDNVTLDLTYYTITVKPSPANANVFLTCETYPQIGKTISTPYGKTITWNVNCENYYPKSGSYTMTGTETKSVILTPYQYTLTIIPTPSDATVTLTAPGFTQVGNSITVDYLTNVTWIVSKEGYTTQTGTYTVTKTVSATVVLSQES